MKRLVYSYAQAHNNVQAVHMNNVCKYVKSNECFIALVEDDCGRGLVAYTQALDEGEEPAYKDAVVVADVDEVRCVARTMYNDRGGQSQTPVNKSKWKEWGVRLYSNKNVMAYEPNKI